MERYLGLDVHATSCTLAVVSATGKRLSWEVVATNGEALVDAVKKIRGAVHLCMEEGTQSAWLYEILSPLVAEVVVVAVTERGRGNKNDTEDAFALAELHRTRSYKKRVFKHVGRFKELRALVKSHGFLTRDLVRSSNRLKAAYRSEGIPTKGRAVYGEDAKEQWLPRLDARVHVATGMLHDAFATLDQLRSEAERALVAEARKHPDFKLLQSVPGLGPIRAAQVLSVVVTPARFRTKRQFWNYCGLAIVTRTSSDWVQQGDQWKRKKVQQTRGLNQDHNHVLKNVFKGAAMTVIQMPDCPLYADYERMLKNGTKPNLARLTIARKIAAIVLAVWKSHQPYDAKRATTKVNNALEHTTDDDKALTT